MSTYETVLISFVIGVLSTHLLYNEIYEKSPKKLEICEAHFSVDSCIFMAVPYFGE